MEYIAVTVLGLLSGSLINAYIHFDEKCHPLIFWYIRLFYCQVECAGVNLFMIAIFIILFLNFGFSPDFLSYGILFTFLGAAAVKDLKSRQITNSLVITGIFSGLAAALSSLNYYALMEGILGFAAVGIIMLFLSFLIKGGIGTGDAKLVACTGIFLGLQQVLTALLISTIISGVAGLVLLVFRKINKKSRIPFAPFIFAGSLITVLIG